MRQLARLVYSNELLIASMVSVSLLDAERDTYEEAIRLGILSGSEWSPIAKEDTVRARRAMYGYAQVFQVGAPENTLDKYLDGSAGRTGYCGALTEAGAVALVLRHWLGPTPFPLEVNVDGQISQIEERIANKDGPCRLTLLRQIMAHPQVIPTWFDSPNLSWKEWIRWKVAARLPWLRQWVALGLTEMAMADYMSGPYSRYHLPGE